MREVKRGDETVCLAFLSACAKMGHAVSGVHARGLGSLARRDGHVV